MGNTHLHAQLPMQLVLEMGAGHVRGGLAGSMQPPEDRDMDFMHVSVPAILQGSFPACPEVLEPAVCRGATGGYPGSASRFLPGMSCLHQDHHLHFCCMARLISHGAFLLSLGYFAGLQCSRNRRPGLDGQSLAFPNTLPRHGVTAVVRWRQEELTRALANREESHGDVDNSH